MELPVCASVRTEASSNNVVWMHQFPDCQDLTTMSWESTYVLKEEHIIAATTFAYSTTADIYKQRPAVIHCGIRVTNCCMRLPRRDCSPSTLSLEHDPTLNVSPLSSCHHSPMQVISTGPPTAASFVFTVVIFIISTPEAHKPEPMSILGLGCILVGPETSCTANCFVHKLALTPGPRQRCSC